MVYILYILGLYVVLGIAYSTYMYYNAFKAVFDNGLTNVSESINECISSMSEMPGFCICTTVFMPLLFISTVVIMIVGLIMMKLNR